ncbi:MAG: antitoxin Xre/MbcA/ParS toxin-binding domain-containing protein [Pseudomonadota bacterium]
MLAARLGISQDYLLTQLRLPKSTMASRIARNGTLSAVEQDRIYRVERVLWRSQQVFEDAAAAVAWINRPNRALGGVAPLTLLDTEAGYELVLDTLGRIEYGVFS